MSIRRPAHADRRRAEAFGLAADDYDRYRPRYPRSLIDGLVESGHLRALDVGAGTGIASAQLIEAGAEVLAVEPDSRMAQVATENGIHTEQATFEDWKPAGRSFDLVVFAQSFHWVPPQRALEKVASILRPGGRLALLSNRLTPVSPTRQGLDEAYAGLLDASQLACSNELRGSTLGDDVRSMSPTSSPVPKGFILRVISRVPLLRLRWF
jgi:SAM-dependent methyltransferase